MGLAMMPITTAGMNSVPVSQVGGASALNNVTRQLAGSFGIAVLTAVMQKRQVFHYTNLAERITADSNAASLLGQLQGYLTHTGAHGADKAAAAILTGLISRQSMVLAIGDTFIVAAVFIFIAIPLGFLLNKHVKKIEVKKDFI